MKKLTLIILLVLLVCNVKAQNVFGRLSSSAYFYETYTDKDNSANNIRSFNILNLTASKDKFALKTRLNFETDFSNSYEDDPRLRFYNLYLEGKNLFNLVTVKFGRQTLINSLGSLFDGLSFKIKHKQISISAYYGGNVPAYQKLEFTDDLEKDYVLGAKVNYKATKELKFGLDYINKNFKPEEYTADRLDENYDPIQSLIRRNSTQYHFLSANVYYHKTNLLRLSAKAVYDLNFQQASRINFSGRVQATKKLGINVYYNYRESRISYNSIFSVFNYGNSQEIESGIDYKINKNFSLFGKYGYVKYKDDNSSRLSAGLNTRYGSLSYRKTFGYAGELDAISLYTAKSYLKGKITPSAGITYTTYKLDEDSDSETLIALNCGVNYRPVKKISFDFQTQFYNNKYYKNDLRFLLRANYFFRIN